MRMRMKALTIVLVIPLALAACGGSTANTTRDNAISEITKQMTDAGASQAVIDCMITIVKGLSDDDLVAIDTETASEAVKAKFVADNTACATAG